MYGMWKEPFPSKWKFRCLPFLQRASSTCAHLGGQKLQTNSVPLPMIKVQPFPKELCSLHLCSTFFGRNAPTANGWWTTAFSFCCSSRNCKIFFKFGGHLLFPTGLGRKLKYRTFPTGKNKSPSSSLDPQEERGVGGRWGTPRLGWSHRDPCAALDPVCTPLFDNNQRWSS